MEKKLFALTLWYLLYKARENVHKEKRLNLDIDSSALSLIIIIDNYHS